MSRALLQLATLALALSAPGTAEPAPAARRPLYPHSGHERQSGNYGHSGHDGHSGHTVKDTSSVYSDRWLQILGEYIRDATGADSPWGPVQLNLPVGGGGGGGARGSSLPVLLVPVPVPVPDRSQSACGAERDRDDDGVRYPIDQRHQSPAPRPPHPPPAPAPAPKQRKPGNEPFDTREEDEWWGDDEKEPPAPARAPVPATTPAAPSSTEAPTIVRVATSEQLLAQFLAQRPSAPHLPPALLDDAPPSPPSPGDLVLPPLGVTSSTGAPPRPAWRRPLHLRAELTVPRADYTEPYELWWDSASGASRLELHGGASTALTTPRAGGLFQQAEIRVERSEGSATRRCTLAPPRPLPPRERGPPALPDVTDFYFAGYGSVEGVRVEAWRHEVRSAAGGEAVTHRHELLVTRDLHDEPLPYRYSVAADSSVLGAGADGYAHHYRLAEASGALPAKLFQLDTATACDVVETLQPENGDFIVDLRIGESEQPQPALEAGAPQAGYSYQQPAAGAPTQPHGLDGENKDIATKQPNSGSFSSSFEVGQTGSFGKFTPSGQFSVKGGHSFGFGSSGSSETQAQPALQLSAKDDGGLSSGRHSFSFGSGAASQKSSSSGTRSSSDVFAGFGLSGASSAPQGFQPARQWQQPAQQWQQPAQQWQQPAQQWQQPAQRAKRAIGDLFSSATKRLQPLKEFTQLAADTFYDNALKSFKSQFNRKYIDATEEAIRKNLFIQNNRFITSGNREGAPFEMGVNFLSDRLDAELDNLLGVSDAAGERTPAERFPHAATVVPSLAAALPAAFDWRNRSAVTPARYQGSCSSCWAFAVTGAVEGALAIQTDKLVPLSEQVLVDCAQPFGGNGCNGTWPSHAFDYVQERGLPSLASYGAHREKVEACRADRVPPVTRISAHVNVTADSVPALKVAIGNHSPTVVIIDGRAKSFIYYKKGVLFDNRCKKNRPGLNHAVLAVGWGEAGAEAGAAGGPHFIVKNSWSAAWGEEGFARLHAPSSACGVLAVPSYPRLAPSDVQDEVLDAAVDNAAAVATPIA